MNFSRAITSATYVWILGIILFTVAIYLPLGENTERIANLTLHIAIVPLAWFGARHYYKKAATTPGYLLAIAMMSMTIVLDALITVPVLIIPAGGSYSAFFGDLGFWIIALEYMATVHLYAHLKRRKSLTNINF